MGTGNLLLKLHFFSEGPATRNLGNLYICVSESLSPSVRIYELYMCACMFLCNTICKTLHVSMYVRTPVLYLLCIYVCVICKYVVRTYVCAIVYVYCVYICMCERVCALVHVRARTCTYCVCVCVCICVWLLVLRIHWPMPLAHSARFVSQHV